MKYLFIIATLMALPLFAAELPVAIDVSDADALTITTSALPDGIIATVTENAPGDYTVTIDGKPFRNWRDHITTTDDIWQEVIEAGNLPGTTSAPKLQPIAARIVMLQSGMRAPMGIKVKGPSLEAIENVALELESLLKQVPSIAADTVTADRLVGKPYLEIDLDREALARYGLHIEEAQQVIEVAVGGKRITSTIEGRERYPVRVRYLRELRDTPEDLNEILVPTPTGAQIPLGQLAEIRYARGPQAIKSEDTFLVGYVVFDKVTDAAELPVAIDVSDADALTITTSALPDGIIATVTENAPGDYTVTIDGTPTATGNTNVVIQATDGDLTATAGLTFQVTQAVAPNEAPVFGVVPSVITFELPAP